MSDQGLRASVELMRERGLGPEAVTVFEHYYRQLEAGALGTIPEESIEPLGEIQALGEVEVSDEDARRALSQTAVIKLNGGLGTGMGMTGAKSALEVRDGLTFLDIIALQVLALRERWGVELPLVLMNSFRTSRGVAADPREVRHARRRRPAARLHPERRAQARPQGPRAGVVARRPRARVVPARPR